MKKRKNVWFVLLMALLFTGCTEEAFPEKNTDKMEQNLSSETWKEVTGEDASENVDEEKYHTSDQQTGHTEAEDAVMMIFSEEELAHIEMAMENYYTSINRRLLSYAQVDSASSFIQEYDGYAADEVVLFEVSVENSEGKRYIAVGSKDGWNNCSILNEGY